MGISFSCPIAVYHDLVNDFESSITNSFIFWDKEVNNSCQSISYEATETEHVVSADAPLNNRNDKFAAFANSEYTEIDDIKEKTTEFLALDRPKHKAAIKLQKVYKSFRTRRKLADCAVVIEQSWWKLLDFAELKRSSISFFDIEKHETAISRWSRARTRAAKVGKGLSKNSRAQKLALQHWLEAIDPRHRYGHNLRFYYNKWLHCQSKEPFFYWLDIGEGKEVNLVDKCPRSKLQDQCIKYLGPMERMIYEVVLEKGKFCYKQSGKLVDTTGEHSNVKWIFVLSTSMTLYVGQKQKGTFQHSSFLAGGATSAAGRIVVQEGILKAIWPHSGHYRPTPENFHDFILFLSGNNVDLTDVKMDPVDEEDSFSEQGSVHRRNISSEEDPTEKDGLKIEEMNAGFSTSERTNSALEPARPKQLLKKLTNILIPNKTDFLERLKFEYKFVESSTNTLATGSSVSGYETVDNLFDYNNNNKDIISKESIMKRINSLKGMNSYQLGKQLSCKWTTGAGPRIGCVRDYPSRLQFHALEQVDLSPRSAG